MGNVLNSSGAEAIPLHSVNSNFQPLIRRKSRRNQKAEIVGGECGSDAGEIVVRSAAKREDSQSAAKLGTAESGGLGVREGAELASASLDEAGGNLIGKRSSGSAGAG